MGRPGFEPWVWSLGQEDPWRREWQPTPVFLPGKSQDRRAWWSSVHDVTKGSDMIKWQATTYNNYSKRSIFHNQKTMKYCIRHQPWETICSQSSSLPSLNPRPGPQFVWVSCGWLGTRLLCPWALFQVTVGIWRCWGMGGPTEWWGWGASGTKDWQRAGGWGWKGQSLIHKGVHLYLLAPRRGSQAVTKSGEGFWRSERMRFLEQPSSFSG